MIPPFSIILAMCAIAGIGFGADPPYGELRMHDEPQDLAMFSDCRQSSIRRRSPEDPRRPRLWRRDPRVNPVLIISGVLIALGLLGTFPEFFEQFAD
jgi:hypothetical protein